MSTTPCEVEAPAITLRPYQRKAVVRAKRAFEAAQEYADRHEEVDQTVRRASTSALERARTHVQLLGLRSSALTSSAIQTALARALAAHVLANGGDAMQAATSVVQLHGDLREASSPVADDGSKAN